MTGDARVVAVLGRRQLVRLGRALDSFVLTFFAVVVLVGSLSLPSWAVGAAPAVSTAATTHVYDSSAGAPTPHANTRSGAFHGYDAALNLPRAAGDVLATKGGTSIVKYDADFAIGQLTSRGAKASDLTRVAESQGWRRVQNPNGPIKYVDDSDVPRLTLKSGSARAPGSNFPHVEVRNAAGRRVDPYGNPVTRRSPGNHTPIEWDLP